MTKITAIFDNDEYVIIPNNFPLNIKSSSFGPNTKAILRGDITGNIDDDAFIGIFVIYANNVHKNILDDENKCVEYMKQLYMENIRPYDAPYNYYLRTWNYEMNNKINNKYIESNNEYVKNIMSSVNKIGLKIRNKMDCEKLYIAGNMNDLDNVIVTNNDKINEFDKIIEEDDIEIYKKGSLIVKNIIENACITCKFDVEFYSIIPWYLLFVPNKQYWFKITVHNVQQ